MNEAERRRIDERADAARAEAGRLARRILDSGRGGEAVYLFGSLAQGRPSSLDFDIDLALEGGDCARAMEVAADSPFRVDIVELEALPAHIRARVRETGIRLAIS